MSERIATGSRRTCPLGTSQLDDVAADVEVARRAVWHEGGAIPTRARLVVSAETVRAVIARGGPAGMGRAARVLVGGARFLACRQHFDSRQPAGRRSRRMDVFDHVTESHRRIANGDRFARREVPPIRRRDALDAGRSAAQPERRPVARACRAARQRWEVRSGQRDRARDRNVIGRREAARRVRANIRPIHVRSDPARELRLGRHDRASRACLRGTRVREVRDWFGIRRRIVAGSAAVERTTG